MTNYKYPAVFTLTDKGKHLVTFPDIDGCRVQGDTPEEAMLLAERMLGLVIYERDNNATIQINTPTQNIKELKAKFPNGELKTVTADICYFEIRGEAFELIKSSIEDEMAKEDFLWDKIETNEVKMFLPSISSITAEWLKKITPSVENSVISVNNIILEHIERIVLLISTAENIPLEKLRKNLSIRIKNTIILEILKCKCSNEEKSTDFQNDSLLRLKSGSPPITKNHYCFNPFIFWQLETMKGKISLI